MRSAHDWAQLSSKQRQWNECISRRWLLLLLLLLLLLSRLRQRLLLLCLRTEVRKINERTMCKTLSLCADAVGC